MCTYRDLNPEQKAEVLRHRRSMGYPLHAPPHLNKVKGWFLISSATYEHRPYFCDEEDRILLLQEILSELQRAGISCSSLVILPNHYHLLIQCERLGNLTEPLRRVHARTAYRLNRRAGIVGRRIWYRFSDRLIRDERHYYATLNYIHYNAVKHGYVEKPLDWACSSAHWTCLVLEAQPLL